MQPKPVSELFGLSIQFAFLDRSPDVRPEQLVENLEEAGGMDQIQGLEVFLVPAPHARKDMSRTAS